MLRFHDLLLLLSTGSLPVVEAIVRLPRSSVGRQM
jgi:hypothetical protein